MGVGNNRQGNNGEGRGASRGCSTIQGLRARIMKMTDIKGDRLYVELGASQVRRRLKHFGHGVRKVEAVGRKQAVIIHTATGEHLQEWKRSWPT